LNDDPRPAPDHADDAADVEEAKVSKARCLLLLCSSGTAYISKHRDHIAAQAERYAVGQARIAQLGARQSRRIAL
jgi:hypothetical protein